MVARRPSLIGRFFRLITLRLIPLVLIIGIFWSGYQVVQAVVRQIDERSAIEDRLESFPGTATSIAFIAEFAANATIDPSPTTSEPAVQIVSTDEVTAEPAVLVETEEPTVEPSATSTETTEPTVAETNTPLPSDTPEPETETPTLEPTEPPATETELPTATDAPTETEIPTQTPTNTTVPTKTITPSSTSSPTATEDVSNRFQATNTPQSAVFVTNTPVGQEAPLATISVPTEPEQPTDTPVPPTNTEISPTDTAIPATPIPPTPTDEPIAVLPTYLPPREGEAGQIINGTAVPTIVPLLPRDNQPLVNIILLGGDDELTNDGSVRTDTMIIVSINRDTNTVSMLSLPRDLFVYIPTVNGAMERLNVVYGFGEAIGWTDGGFGLLRQTIAYNFGINVHYYAKVDFSGFKDLIDTLDGVEIAVDCPYQDYQLIGAEVPDGAVIADDEGLQTLNVGVYQMSGGQALWYARTRLNSSDFDRGRRQQQLLRAIWRKGLNSLSITTAPQLYDQMLDIIETDMGVNEFISLIPIALNLDVGRIRSFPLIRTYHTLPWQPPDGAFVQLPIYETMRPLLEDFYRAPVSSQLLVEAATIEVVNGTENLDWDQVAADRLAYEGFRASWGGEADNLEYEQTVLIDYTGDAKGTSRTEIAQALNIRPDNIRVEPDPNRTADFRVILGQNYNSCTVGGVLPIEG